VADPYLDIQLSRRVGFWEPSPMIANGSGQMKGEVMAGEKETALTCASGLRLVFKGLAGFGLSLDKPFGS
jgi:hypothetical protein